ncbi:MULTISPECIES: CAP domain-containing protein [Paenibacillus]|uniref:CAP domain-containing protein n=1 Tax=Paenibacillus illinoisensis TaxID=59845 RepID=UPI001C8CF992|nr:MULTISPECIES: CAP domain-containing protein [Paenibacillus]MBY0220558.1 serine protease [Paenibacillus illinoisensis]WJH28760.1 CAP domain-containing protein [Paenibacillus sp. CC-CFT742]
MKKNLLKTVVAGSLTAVLAVGIMLPASASAAEVSTYKATIKLTDATSLKTLLEKWMKDNGITVSNGQVVQKPAAQPETTKPETTKPETTKPSQPTQEEKPAATPTKKPENSSNSGNANNTGNTGNNTSNSGNESTQSDFAAQVVKLVNAERAKAGLSALASDALLDKVALAKAKDMSNNNYFDHQSPTYGSPFDMMKQFGVTYSYAGENIAKGQKTPQEVVTAWMNSEGHRANILSKNFTQIGVGYYNGYWAQEFIGK